MTNRFPVSVEMLVEDMIRLIRDKIRDDLAEWKEIVVEVGGEVVVRADAEDILGKKEGAIQQLSRSFI